MYKTKQGLQLQFWLNILNQRNSSVGNKLKYMNTKFVYLFRQNWSS